MLRIVAYGSQSRTLFRSVLPDWIAQLRELFTLLRIAYPSLTEHIIRNS
jgi:hypothetical protein